MTTLEHQRLTAAQTFKSTPAGQTYWNGQGAYQTEYDALYAALVPDSGSAATLNGELVRGVTRLSYEFYNNGNCNACERLYSQTTCQCYDCGGDGYFASYDEDEENTECPTCCGSGETDDDDYECQVDEFYNGFLNLIKLSVPDTFAITEKIHGIIASDSYGDYSQYTDHRNQAYVELMDRVMHYVTTNEDKEIPTWYTRD
jgi:hypothetical protein